MSYCRWHNTSLALQDCVNAIEEVEEEGFDELSSMEQQGMMNLVNSAVELLHQLPIEVLARAGVDLRVLPTHEDVRMAEPAKMRHVA